MILKRENCDTDIFRIFSDEDPDDECNAFQFGSEDGEAAKKAAAADDVNSHHSDNDDDDGRSGGDVGLGSANKIEVR